MMLKKHENPVKGIRGGIGKPKLIYLLAAVLGLAVLIAAFDFLFGLAFGGDDSGYWLAQRQPHISITGDSGTIECGFVEAEIDSDCYTHDRYKIELDVIASGGVSRDCLFVNPRDNEKINIVYRDVLFSNTLSFVTAISEHAIGRKKSPVYVDVYINNALKKRITQVDKTGWLTTDVDTSGYYGKAGDVRLVIYADQERNRHFCFNAKTTEKKTPDDYFILNLEKAIAKVDDTPCDIYNDDSVWPHNEKTAPFKDSKIFERWDCDKNLIEKKLIWRTVGKSYAVAGEEYREAIWFHPETDKIKSLTYNGINIEADRIVGYYGMNDYSVNKCRNSETSFIVIVNGEKRYDKTYTPTPGWTEFSIPVEGTLKDVEFQVTTTRATWNHFFFNAYIEHNEEGKR